MTQNEAGAAPIAAAAALDAPAPTFTPIGASERFLSIDALRGFALLGILWMNIPYFALSEHGWIDPRLDGDFTGLNKAVWLLGHFIFDLKMMAIFSMLFGAGLAVMGERAARRGASLAGVYYRRLFWLLVIGLIHAYLIWPGDILVTYACCGALIYPLRRVPAHFLAAIGLAMILIAVPIGAGYGLMMEQERDLAQQAQAVLAEGGTPDEAMLAAQESWKETLEENVPPQEKFDEERAAHAGVWRLIEHNAASVWWWHTEGFAFWGFWRIGGLMLLGVALLRLGVFTAQRSMRFYAAMAALGYPVGWLLIAVGYRRLTAHDFDFVFFFKDGQHWNYVGSLLVALAHTGVFMMLVKSGALRAVIMRLAAVGRMALTNYLAQSVLMTFVFFPWGLNLWNDFDRAPLALFVVGVWTIQLLWSPWWLARFRFGPMEWHWRSLTYWRRQPMR